MRREGELRGVDGDRWKEVKLVGEEKRKERRKKIKGD